jgi:hypothetical protein
MDTLINLYDVFSHQIEFEDSELKNADLIKERVKMIFKHRKVEIETFNSFIRLMSRFYTYFEQFEIEYHKFHEDLVNFKRNEWSELDRFLNPLTSSEMDMIDRKKTNPESVLLERIKGFEEVDRKNLGFLKNFLDLASDSPILNFMVKETVRLENENKPKMNLKLFTENLNKVYEKFNELGNRMKSGNIQINEFEKLAKVDPKNFNSTYTKSAQWKNTLSSFMKSILMDDKQIEQRLNQYEIFCKLNNIVEIGNLILEIRVKNGLSGDFGKLENALNLVIKCFFIL